MLDELTIESTITGIVTEQRVIQGNALDLSTIADKSVQTCVTSPPYWGLRDYGEADQLGLERTPELYVAKMVEVFREVKRVLRDDGTLWLNLGDTYAANRAYQVPDGKWIDVGNSMGMKAADLGCKPKDLVGIPWMVAFALRADGWYLRQDIIWAKPNPMPESVRDRCTKAHEYIFLLSKSDRYQFDFESIKEAAVTKAVSRNRNAEGYNPSLGNGKDRFSPGERTYGTDGKRNRRSVWNISTKPFRGAHFATFPPDLVEPCIIAGSREGDLVLDPFAGAGTVGVVCKRHNRNFIGTELNPAYCEMANTRIEQSKGADAKV